TPPRLCPTKCTVPPSILSLKARRRSALSRRRLRTLGYEKRKVRNPARRSRHAISAMHQPDSQSPCTSTTAGPGLRAGIASGFPRPGDPLDSGAVGPRRRPGGGGGEIEPTVGGVLRMNRERRFLRQLERVRMLGVFDHVGRVAIAPLRQYRIPLYQPEVAHLLRRRLDSRLFALLANRADARILLVPVHRTRHRLPEVGMIGALEQQHFAASGVNHHQHGLRTLERGRHNTDRRQSAHAISCVRRPNVKSACSTRSLHGTVNVRRMKWRYFCLAENSGPGAIAMPRSSARRFISNASTLGGNSTHSTKPPVGLVTRVPEGKNRAIAWMVRSAFCA